MGRSMFDAGGRKLKQLETKVISNGPLFAEISVNYLFSDGATYQANVRYIQEYDFIEIREQMNGSFNDKKSKWQITWSDFSPTHRQAPNHPHFSGDYEGENKSPGFSRFNWEKIDQKMLNGHLGIIQSKDTTEIPFQIDTYGNYPAEKTVTSAVFWDERSMQSLGAFMEDALGWNDREYPIWQISGRLSIQFHYRNKLLSWEYPIVNGTRTSALSFYNHQKDIDVMNKIEQKCQPQKHSEGFTYRVHMSQLSYNTFLQNRYSTISLNKVKDWVLTYPDSFPGGPFIFKKGNINTIRELEQRFLYSSFVLELPVSGTCQNSGYGPTSSRQFYESWVDAFNRLLPEMSSVDRERFIAMFLFHAYVAAGEEYMPMRNMLSGHPNFLADVKSTPAMAAFLFPQHPEAKDWEELFNKYIDLNTRYHTRPAVSQWNAKGGRWTENLGTYVWAFLRPTLRTNYLLQNYTDGINHVANDRMRQIASWLLNSLSAPYNGESLDFYRNKDNRLDNHYWGIVTLENEPRRVYPPQGAHSARRMPSASLWLLGQELKNYDPLLSENISYISHPDDQEAEVLDENKDPFKIMYPEKYDKGTLPDLRSVKFTGYGIILRSAVGTPEELSIHLQQIDRVPNYRWGLAADGGCGNIYFYAAGKSYSHNGKEDSGDRRIQDTDLVTNFGVFKDGKFKSIGMNELEKPMFGLGIGQFAEIVSSQKNPYSWPEYLGRSVMLIGSDYFILYDDVHDNNIAGRLSWFTHPKEDFPEITIIKAGGMDTSSSNGKIEKTELFGKESKGIWYDGSGDFLTFVSHKKGYETEQSSYGAIITSPIEEKDYIFRNDLPVEVNEEGRVFSGTAGFIRIKRNGEKELALFHGNRIGSNGFEIRTDNVNSGISARFTKNSQIKGQYSSERQSEISFYWSDGLPKDIKFYLDGVLQIGGIEKNSLTLSLPSRNHIWNLTSELPDLICPKINFTRNEKGKVAFGIYPVFGADQYRFEYSMDIGKTWTKLKEQTSITLKIDPLKGERKGFVRVIALNKSHESQPSAIYPVYFTFEKPHYPDGLKLNIDSEKNELTWGKVLGCNKYRLYRREEDSKEFHIIYEGQNSSFSDNSMCSGINYEYAVTAVNGNGESGKCKEISTNPSSWLNFDPLPGELFRRGVYDEGKESSGIAVDLYYPE